MAYYVTTVFQSISYYGPPRIIPKLGICICIRLSINVYFRKCNRNPAFGFSFLLLMYLIPHKSYQECGSWSYMSCEQNSNAVRIIQYGRQYRRIAKSFLKLNCQYITCAVHQFRCYRCSEWSEVKRDKFLGFILFGRRLENGRWPFVICISRWGRILSAGSSALTETEAHAEIDVTSLISSRFPLLANLRERFLERIYCSWEAKDWLGKFYFSLKSHMIFFQIHSTSPAGIST